MQITLILLVAMMTGANAYDFRSRGLTGSDDDLDDYREEANVIDNIACTTNEDCSTLICNNLGVCDICLSNAHCPDAHKCTLEGTCIEMTDVGGGDVKEVFDVDEDNDADTANKDTVKKVADVDDGKSDEGDVVDTKIPPEFGVGGFVIVFIVAAMIVGVFMIKTSTSDVLIESELSSSDA